MDKPLAYTSKDNCVVIDFETLSVDRVNGVVLSMALLNFDTKVLTSQKPYEYEFLVQKAQFIKFDVEEQVKKYKRVISKDTLNWWSEQSKEAQKQLKPSKKDQSIADLYDFLITKTNPDNIDRIMCRGQDFDLMFLEFIMKQIEKPMPYPHWKFRDTRSLIDGMAWGTDIRNGFIPEGLNEKFVAHDPRHDIAMDVMRIQSLIREIEGSDEIPF